MIEQDILSKNEGPTPRYKKDISRKSKKRGQYVEFERDWVRDI